MLSFEISTLDEVAVHFDRAGLAALLRVLLKFGDDDAGEMRVVLDLANDECRLSRVTPFGEPAAKRVVLSCFPAPV